MRPNLAPRRCYSAVSRPRPPPPASEKPPTPIRFKESVITQALMSERSDEENQFGRWLFTGPCEFIGSSNKLEEIKLPAVLPQIAFAGRSNVGKSTLLNTLLGRKMAFVSKMPGRTQTLNFYSLRKQLYMVDLPGFGFANAPVDLVRSWNINVKAYVSGGHMLMRVCYLVDSRHGLQKIDREIIGLFDEFRTPWQLVLTKTDKLSAQQNDELHKKMFAEVQRHPSAYPEVLMVSSAKKTGIEAMRTSLAMGSGLRAQWMPKVKQMKEVRERWAEHSDDSLI